MAETIKKVPYNNPVLIPLGDYDIKIKKSLTLEVANSKKIDDNKGKYHIIQKHEIDGKEITYVDMVTLKKVLDMEKVYPVMEKEEVFAISQLRLYDEDKLEILGDIVEVTDNMN